MNWHDLLKNSWFEKLIDIEIKQFVIHCDDKRLDIMLSIDTKWKIIKNWIC